MKSAYELAMERLGGEKHYSEAQKEQLAAIDAKYDARRAELDIRFEDDIRKAAGNAEKAEELRAERVRELARIEAKREAEKNALRGAQGD
jgi:hypothetical protein